MISKNIASRDIVVYWNKEDISRAAKDISWCVDLDYRLNIPEPDLTILLSGTTFYLVDKNLKNPTPNYNIKVLRVFFFKSHMMQFARYYLEKYKEAFILGVNISEKDVLDEFIKTIK